jgi:3-carboxy-cis,cis-muconate cycloisomerase
MSALYENYFYAKEINAFFTDEALIQAMLDFESALATAQAHEGLIPAAAARAIEAQCHAQLIDFQRLRHDIALGGNACIPLVKQLTSLVKAKNRENTEGPKFVHYGATSQDVIDTATMLQAKKALQLIDNQLITLIQQLTQLANAHRDTVMIGRSFMQHARPITFGFKVATWLDGIFRTKKKVEQLLGENFALQLGGAVGNLSSMGDKGITVAAKMADILALKLPLIPYHTQRDRFVEIASTLGILTGNLGKIAKDISLLMQTEIGEVGEPSGIGKGGSSTMPHKRNPVSCIAILANAQRVPALVSTMFSSMIQDHERATGAWHAEWETLTDIIKLTGGALNQALVLTNGLEVNVEKMRQNLENTEGVIYAENISLALSEKIGKTEAHELVEMWCKAANTVDAGNPTAGGKGVHLKVFISNKKEIMEHFTPTQFNDLFNPKNSVGLSNLLINNILNKNKIYTMNNIMHLSNGIDVRYKLEGNPSLPVLVFSNSLGTDYHMWDAVMPFLLPHFQILRYDTRGHGKTSVTPRPYSIELLGNDLIALLDDLNIKKATFCGLSMGGLIGQWLGINHPDRLEKLIICNTAAIIGVVEVWNERIENILKEGTPSIWDATLGRWFTSDFQQETTKIAAVKNAFLGCNTEGYAACCAAVRDADFRDSIDKITTPTLIIAGKYDPVTTVEHAEFLASKIGNSEMEILEAAHLSSVECAEDFAATVLSFLL